MYVIYDDSGFLVAGYNSAHMIIQRTTEIQKAWKFNSPEQARQWAKKYVGAGFGLDSYKIVKL